MKTQLTRPLFSVLICTTLLFVSCQKRKAEKRLFGNYSRELPSTNYTDSTTELLLLNESILFSKGEEMGLVSAGGEFSADVYYTTKKSDDPNYDLELKFQDLDYSDWLPKNYVNGTGGVTYNSVVPNTLVLDQVRFYVKTDDHSLIFLMRYPAGDVVQLYLED